MDDELRRYPRRRHSPEMPFPTLHEAIDRHQGRISLLLTPYSLLLTPYCSTANPCVRNPGASRSDYTTQNMCSFRCSSRSAVAGAPGFD